MTILTTMAIRIIKEQELIIGPIAWDEAKKVQGMTVQYEKREVTLQQDEPGVVDRLVSQYERLFGRASREVCKEAVRDIISELPQDQLPTALR
ncbi:MAG: hypothetical protein HY565_05205 [Candidatus Kerfeldbacteria bacterium]|nr:hypothetical protein [Candidatus Kerfeldbacteria bacterium]